MRLLSFILFCFMQYSLHAQPDFNTLPVTAWKFKTNQPIYSSPVVINQTIYVGGSDSALYALDIGSGKILWKFITKGEIRSDVAIHLDKLFLLSGDGAVYCLNKNTGKEIWIFKT